MRSKVIYYGCGWKLTKRELVFSTAIIFIMLAAGFFLHEKISSAMDDKNQEYYQALQINDDVELFQYGMRTSVGNAFVFGTLEAIDTVSYPEINGEYAYIEKVKEKYTKHTRKVTKTRVVNGKTETYTETETYWTWDEIARESIHCDNIMFLDTEFSYGTIKFPYPYLIETIKESSNIRYKYYVCDTSYQGTIYAKLQNGTINEAEFINGAEIENALHNMVNRGTTMLVLFWIIWLALIAGIIYIFYKLDNKWLEE